MLRLRYVAAALHCRGVMGVRLMVAVVLVWAGGSGTVARRSPMPPSHRVAVLWMCARDVHVGCDATQVAHAASLCLTALHSADDGL